MSIIQEGVDKGYIVFDDEQKYISYPYARKKYRYSDPEEPVRAESYLQLILNYGYNAKRITLEETVPRRTPNDWADIVVFEDDDKKKPYIVVETKEPDATDAEFLQAIEQGFGNTNSLRAKYLWVTSRRLNEYYDVAGFRPGEREENKIADLPKAGRTNIPKAKFYKGANMSGAH